MEKEDVEKFLQDFHFKTSCFDIIFRDERNKNFQTLIELEITPLQRLTIIQSLKPEDYSEGPLPDTLYHTKGLWVFGTLIKKKEIYIKISMGHSGSKTICISFHIAERKINYPFKKSNK